MVEEIRIVIKWQVSGVQIVQLRAAIKILLFEIILNFKKSFHYGNFLWKNHYLTKKLYENGFHTVQTELSKAMESD